MSWRTLRKRLPLCEPENVTRDTATFNLPFISLGQVGEGKLMVIGNPHYNSILRCPNGYSWDGGVNKNGAVYAQR